MSCIQEKFTGYSVMRQSGFVLERESKIDLT